ncbi:MAG: hypothetical protein AAFN74_25925 [Myxococcota bacterium]
MNRKRGAFESSEGEPMLDAYIIDAIRRQEREQQQERERIWLDLPVETPISRDPRDEITNPDGHMIIIPLNDPDSAEEEAA